MTNRRNFLMAFLAIVTLPALPALAVDTAANPPGAMDRPGPRLSDEERARLEQMSPEERRAYMRDKMGDRPMRDGDRIPERLEDRLTPEQKEKLQAMSPQERREFMQNMRQKRQPVDANKDGIPDRMAERLSPEQREKLKSMSPEERRSFFKERRADRMDRDNNPPGRRGGPGTNWENPPGPQGGPGASPDPVQRHLSPEERAKLEKMSPEQRQAYMQEMRSKYKDRLDRDNNPPGPQGGPGTNWENRPGPQGGPGASPDYQRYDRDNNPPGAAGGTGTNWENRPGPQGGPGASPDRRQYRERPQRERGGYR